MLVLLDLQCSMVWMEKSSLEWFGDAKCMATGVFSLRVYCNLGLLVLERCAK